MNLLILMIEKPELFKFCRTCVTRRLQIEPIDSKLLLKREICGHKRHFISKILENWTFFLIPHFIKDNGVLKFFKLSSSILSKTNIFSSITPNFYVISFLVTTPFITPEYLYALLLSNRCLVLHNSTFLLDKFYKNQW